MKLTFPRRLSTTGLTVSRLSFPTFFSRLPSTSLADHHPRTFSSVSRVVNMPHPNMPIGIVTGGNENLDLNNPSLFKTKAYINGCWVDADGHDSFNVYNKATGALIGTVPDMSKSETQVAIDSAQDAFQDWSKTTAKYRHDLLIKLFQAHEENSEDLAKIIVAENGKPFTEAKGEIAYSNSFLEWFAEEALRTYGHTVPSPLPNLRNVIQFEPIGVAGLINPWNFPAAMITRKAAPALAAGCTVVIKAPSETPFSALAFASLAEKVGFPKGTINVVTCSKGENEIQVGKQLCENPKIRKISFTGSTRVGKILMKQSASTLKKLSMELGGNAPLIVFQDADLDLAVQGAIVSKFRGSGQTCVCANRIYVHQNVMKPFLKKFKLQVEQFHIGYGMDSKVTHGPLVNQSAIDKIQQHVEKSLEAGANLLIGGKPGQGLFFEPTILHYDNNNNNTSFPTDQEETFGPLAMVYSFESEKDVIDKANNVDVGLAAYFFSKDVATCFRVAEQLQVGMVGINTGVISQNVVPFGGIHESGFGREGGKSGIHEYLVQKLLVFGGI